MERRETTTINSFLIFFCLASWRICIWMDWVGLVLWMWIACSRLLLILKPKIIAACCMQMPHHHCCWLADIIFKKRKSQEGKYFMECQSQTLVPSIPYISADYKKKFFRKPQTCAWICWFVGINKFCWGGQASKKPLCARLTMRTRMIALFLRPSCWHSRAQKKGCCWMDAIRLNGVKWYIPLPFDKHWQFNAIWKKRDRLQCQMWWWHSCIWLTMKKFAQNIDDIDDRHQQHEIFRKPQTYRKFADLFA